MKQISLLYMLLLCISTLRAEKNTAGSKEDLASFFATKNSKEIENKIQNDPLFAGNETPGTLKAFEDAMYNIAFKNKVLNTDDKLKIFKLLLDSTKGKSEEIKKINSIGRTYTQFRKRKTAEDIEQERKLGISPEIIGLELAVSLDSFPGVKLFLRNGVDVKKTNTLLQSLSKEGDDLSIAKYLAEHGATLEPFIPAGEKYNLERYGAFHSFGLNPWGQIDERMSKRLMDYGLNLNKIGYYALPNQPEKQGTILDLAYDMLDFVKKSKPDVNFTKEKLAESLVNTNKMIEHLKKYGAKRSVELKK